MPGLARVIIPRSPDSLRSDLLFADYGHCLPDEAQRKRGIEKGVIQGTRTSLPPLHEVCTRDNFLRVFRLIQATGGDAAGPDGIRPSEYPDRTAADLLNVYAARLMDGTYRPGPMREIQIAKSSGGFRTIRVANMPDRVVAKAMHLAVEPWIDAQLHGMSYGFRRNRSSMLLFAELERAIEQSKNTVLACADIRQAFDYVQRRFLAQDIARLLGDEQYAQRIISICGGQDDPQGRTIGIAQGNALSPLLLLMHLHCRHDTPLYSGAITYPLDGWYADNRVLLAPSVADGERRLRRSQSLLEGVGLTFKESGRTVIDLRESGRTKAERGEPATATEQASLLGFSLSLREKGLRYAIQESTWNTLRGNLQEAHNEPDVGTAARRTIEGWLNHSAPALTSHADQIVRRCSTLLRETGLGHTVRKSELQSIGQRAIGHWNRLRGNHHGKDNPLLTEDDQTRSYSISGD